MSITNPFELPGRFFKANLHCHTTSSDGESAVATRIAQYRGAGYDILAITDHRATNDVRGLSTPDFLVVGGIEVHPPNPGGYMHHLVALNIPHPTFIDDQRETLEVQEVINRLRHLGGEVFFAHPRWSGHTAGLIRRLTGLAGVEVFNGTACKIGRADSSSVWDELSESGIIYPALAVDDTHRGRDSFLGWSMFRMEKLTLENFMAALRSGAYYSSCGPEILDLRLDGKSARITCSPAAEIHFIGAPICGKSFYADGGPLLTSAQAEVNSDWKYLRVEVVDEKGRRAWTNPVVLNS